MTSSSSSSQDSSPTHSYEHLAPAGKNFEKILDAGLNWLEQYCYGFPNGDKSIIHPQVFESKYPEGHDACSDIPENSRGLEDWEKKQLIGIRINQRGEIGEYRVWLLFHRLTETDSGTQILVLKTFNLDADNKNNVRRKALEQELKAISNASFSSFATSGEHDMVVLIKNVGMVMIEVKTSRIGNAEDQLNVGVAFFRTLLSAVSTTSYLYPIARVVIMPFNDEPSPTTTTIYGTHILHGDIVKDFGSFQRKWKEIIRGMTNAVADPHLSHYDFEMFSAYVVGLWSMMPLRINGLQTHSFDERNFSTSTQLEQVSRMVDEAHLSSSEGIFKGSKKKRIGEKMKANPVSNVVRASDHFTSAAGQKLLYITPEQKQLYEQHRQVIIRGAGGVGKSILIYFKILEIMNDPNETNKSILVVVPHPSHLRFENFLKSNNVNTIIVSELPSNPPPNTVIIIEMNYFRPIMSSSSHGIASYHIFMDDFQWCFRPEEPDVEDRLDFINNFYLACKQSATFLWIAIDPRQETNSLHSLALFEEPNATPKLKIPVFELKQILRNSVEVATVVIKRRKEMDKIIEEIKEREEEGIIRDHTAPEAVQRMKEMMLKGFCVGHHITSCPVKYRSEARDLLSEGSEKDRIVALARDEVKTLIKLNAISPPHIAILSDIYIAEKYDASIRTMLLETFNIETQTIEESLITNNSNAIILDIVDNVASFESPCGIVISRKYRYHTYNLVSRFRSKLVVITPKKEKRKKKDIDRRELSWEPYWEDGDEIFEGWSPLQTWVNHHYGDNCEISYIDDTVHITCLAESDIINVLLHLTPYG